MLWSERMSCIVVLFLVTLMSAGSDSNIETHKRKRAAGTNSSTNTTEFGHEITFSSPTTNSISDPTTEIPPHGTRSKLWAPHSTFTTIVEEHEDDVTYSTTRSTIPKQPPSLLKGPAISSIRHFKSRKNFVRIRKPENSKLQSGKEVTKPESNEGEQGDQPVENAKHALSLGILEKTNGARKNNSISLKSDRERAYGIPYLKLQTQGENSLNQSNKTDNLSHILSSKSNSDSRRNDILPKSKRPTSTSFSSLQDKETATSVTERIRSTKKSSRKKTGRSSSTQKPQNAPTNFPYQEGTGTSHPSPLRDANNNISRPERERMGIDENHYPSAFRKVQESQRLPASTRLDKSEVKYNYNVDKNDDNNQADGSIRLPQQGNNRDQTNVGEEISVNLRDGEDEEGGASSDYFPKVSMDEGNLNGVWGNEDDLPNLEAGDEYESLDPLGSNSLSPSQIGKPDSDVVTDFLRIVESQHTLGANCTAGTDVNLGPGVVNRYAQERFRLEAELTTNRANMLTRFWKYADVRSLEDEYLLHAMVISLVEFDEDIFAGGNCYDAYQYKNYDLFCPYAYRDQDGSILAKDLSREYHYLGNTSEWFYKARKDAERIVKEYSQFHRGSHIFRRNESFQEEILSVKYEDGSWSKPYYDCGGGNIWMITYTIPFFGYNGTYFFKGTSGIDIDLRRVDIDQCPSPDDSSEKENIFAGSDKCKKATTKCLSIKGLGFRRGSYRCECRDGFYFPNVTSPFKHFNGTVLEEEYERKLTGNGTSLYDTEGAFECLPCPFGCDTCVDDRPCVVSLNWIMRTAILILQSGIIAMLPIIGLFTWKYSDVKVVRAASPVLLRFIVLGAFFISCTILVMYPSPNIITCTFRVWLREIGFSLAYGALMLKTWRISVIFRVRSAKAIKITDMDLMKRLGAIVAVFAALLVIRTLVQPPVAIISYTADDLKAWLCKSDWWDHSFTGLELLLLVWGIRLCIVVRKAPSEFNESKYISLAIYNEFLLSLFLNISMLFLQSPANPDLLYIIFFCHVQLTMTLLLCLIFGSKAYIVFRGQGKGGSDELRAPTSKFITKSRSGQTSKQPSVHNSTAFHSSSTSTGQDPNLNPKLPDDVQEEFRRLYLQLEQFKERNMRVGNRHLVAKITAMQEAADNILATSAEVNDGQQTCSGTSPNAKRKTGILSHISEEENPSQPQSTVDTPKPGESRVSDKEVKTLCSGDSSSEETNRSKPYYMEGESKDDRQAKDAHFRAKRTEKVQFKELQLKDTNLDDIDSGEEEREDGFSDEGSIKDACCDEIPMQTLRKRRNKQEASPSNPSAQETELNSSEIGKHKSKDKQQNHRGSGKVVLDLDDKSRFTEEITV